jgi:uncharacterized protein YbjT (DUF2867 family)
MSEFIVVTGASGKTGRALVAELAKQGAAVRAVVRREQAIAGAREVWVGDVTQPESLRPAMQGCTALYHICPNMHPAEVQIGTALIDLAKATHIRRFVYHSVLHPYTQAMPHHWNKLLVEEQLLMSGLDFTILQPTAYYQNLLAYWSAMQAGEYITPYAVHAAISLVDLRDVAEVAAHILLEDGHRAATYPLVGCAALDQQAVADLAGQALGRRVTARSLGIAQWQAQNTHLPAYARNTLAAMFQFYENFGLVGNSRVLAHLLGRAPRTLAGFFAELV